MILKMIMLMTGVILFFSCQTKVASNNGEQNRLIIQSSNSSNSASNNLSPIQASKLTARIGNVEMGKGCAHLYIPDQNLKAGDKVQTVLAGTKPQQVIQMEVATAECADIWPRGEKELFGSDPGVPLHHYILTFSGESKNEWEMGIGVVGLDRPIKVEDGLAVVDLDGDKGNEYFRSCYGNESAALTVWQGKPLTGKPIWFTQYRFNFDTIPTCKDEDYEGSIDE